MSCQRRAQDGWDSVPLFWKVIKEAELRKIGGGTTSYTYSTRGELLTATLPDTRVISYVYDPLGRRIAKRLNGTTTEKYPPASLTSFGGWDYAPLF